MSADLAQHVLIRADLPRCAGLICLDKKAPAPRSRPIALCQTPDGGLLERLKVLRDLPAAAPAGSDAPLYVSPRNPSAADGHGVVDINVNHDGGLRGAACKRGCKAVLGLERESPPLHEWLAGAQVPRPHLRQTLSQAVPFSKIRPLPTKALPAVSPASLPARVRPYSHAALFSCGPLSLSFMRVKGAAVVRQINIAAIAAMQRAIMHPRR
jgi:hypothetical protein